LSYCRRRLRVAAQARGVARHRSLEDRSVLVIRREQVATLSEIACDRFALRLRADLKQWFPDRTSSFDDEQLYREVRAAIDRAAALGFTTERTVARFVVVTLMLGACFDEHCHWARRILADPAPITAERRSRLLMDGMEAALRVNPEDEPGR
jgi:hypothetical protein